VLSNSYVPGPPPSEFYDGLAFTSSQFMKCLAMSAFQAIGALGVSRVDFSGQHTYFDYEEEG
jgi:D-alanine-D-alanine ligase-like ATP-grasp enzyme